MTVVKLSEQLVVKNTIFGQSVSQSLSKHCWFHLVTERIQEVAMSSSICAGAASFFGRNAGSAKRRGHGTLRRCMALVSVGAIASSILLASPVKAEDKIDVAARLSEQFQQVAKKVSPAVVHITTVREVEGPSSGRFGRMPEEELRRFFGEEFFERFFDNPQRKRERKGLGSGVIVDGGKGYVLTNNHVVANASEIKVKLGEGSQYDAEIVGGDPETDLAVLQIKADKEFPEARLGDSAEMKVGHHILAIGNPFGLDRTITSGIISAKGRSNVGIAEYEDFIQTDAAINPGNSGGPLVNMDGEVIGISTAIFSRTGGSMGIGFAVPVNMAESVMQELIEKGDVTRGWLGVSIQPLTPQIARALETDTSHGALVGDVIEDTPADKAGFKRGDLIIALDGEKIEGVKDLRRNVADLNPGDKATFTVVRNGKKKSIKVKIGKRPEKGETVPTLKPEQGWQLGVQVKELTNELRRRLNVRVKEGVVVVDVKPGSTAADAGIRPGMVIVEINKKPVKNVEEFRRILSDIHQGKNLLLLVSFKGTTQYVLVKPPEKD